MTTTIGSNDRIEAGGGKAVLTEHGALARRFVNRTGSDSAEGTACQLSDTTVGSLIVAEANSKSGIAIMLESGIPHGELCLAVTKGPVRALLVDYTDAERNNWVCMSATAGRVDASQAEPQEDIASVLKCLGRCRETVTGGVDILAWIELE
jgi:hypothetical protein